MCDEFTERERVLIYRCVKSRRFDSEELYELYERVSDWAINANTNTTPERDRDRDRDQDRGERKMDGMNRAFECPKCGAPADAGLSGNVEKHVSTTISTEMVGRVCIVGPDDENDMTTVYFHPARYLKAETDRGER